MKLAVLIFALISPLAHAYLGPTNLNLNGQVYLNRVTITNVLCLPEGSKVKLLDRGQKESMGIEYSECRKISSNSNYTAAAVCSQLEGDLVIEVSDNSYGPFQNKHISEIRSLSIVNRACQ